MVIVSEAFQIKHESPLNDLITKRIRRALLDQDAAAYHGRSFQMSLVAQDATGEIIRAVNEELRKEHITRELKERKESLAERLNPNPTIVISGKNDGSGSKFP
jgi:hypothetical protein